MADFRTDGKSDIERWVPHLKKNVKLKSLTIDQLVSCRISKKIMKEFHMTKRIRASIILFFNFSVTFGRAIARNIASQL